MRTGRVLPWLVSSSLLGLSATTGGQSPPAQQRPPVFRTGVDLARITVRVLDRERRPVRDLQQSDFTILVDGVPQEIAAFAVDEIEGATTPPAPWMRDVAPDVATNSLENPRLIVIIVDDVLAPCRDEWMLEGYGKIVRSIIDELGPRDLASIVFTRDNRAPQDFTADRAKLLAAVEDIKCGFVDDMTRRGLGIPMSFGVLKRAIRFLQDVPDRRSAVMYVSVGPDIGGDTLGPKLMAAATAGSGIDSVASLAEHDVDLTLADQLAGIARSAHVAGVPVYSFSPAGLVPPAPPGLPSVIGGIPRAQPGPGMSARATKRANEALRSISNASGGRAVTDTNAPADIVPLIFRENTVYYTIGYRPSYSPADGRFRRVQVKVNRRDVYVDPSDRIVRAVAPDAGSTEARATPATTRALGRRLARPAGRHSGSNGGHDEHRRLRTPGLRKAPDDGPAERRRPHRAPAQRPPRR